MILHLWCKGYLPLYALPGFWIFADGALADDGVDAKARIAGGWGACSDVNGDADEVLGAAVAVVVGFVSIAIAVAAAVVVVTWGQRGVSGIEGNVARAKGML
jgi:hypothetical protein